MPVTYDFKCAHGHTTERRVPLGVEQVMCETCRGPALRQEAVTRPDRAPVPLTSGDAAAPDLPRDSRSLQGKIGLSAAEIQGVLDAARSRPEGN